MMIRTKIAALAFSKARHTFANSILPSVFEFHVGLGKYQVYQAVAILLFCPFFVLSGLAQSISGEAVRHVVENYIKKSVPSNVDATIEFKDLKPSYPVSSEDFNLNVSSANSVVMKGLVTILVKVRCPHKIDETIPVTVRIRTFQNVLVATQTLKPHSEVSPDEVAVIKTESTDMSDPVTDLNQLKHKWTSRWIQNGKALTFDMFDDEPIIKRGDNVTIIFRTKNVVVREQGNALQDGKMDDVIGITNEYKDSLHGKVIGKDEVVLVN
jgi:flagella basal body P-ring formation protein FlgA